MDKRGSLISAFTSVALGAGGAALGRFGAYPIMFNAAAAPFILGAAGASLPVLWNWLSSRPVQKGAYYFPAIDILFKIAAMQPKPACMPPWQKCLALSSLVAAALGASEPSLNNTSLGQGRGPVILAVDNGWASATHWDQAIVPRLNRLIDTAEAKGRSVILLPAALGADGKEAYGQTVDAAHARSMVMNMKPQPWPTNHSYQIKTLENIPRDVSESASLVWLSDGLQAADDVEWARTIGRFGTSDIYSGYRNGPHLLSLAETSGEGMTIKIDRLDAKTDNQATLIFSDEAGRPLLQRRAFFQVGKSDTTLRVDMPSNLRGQMVRVAVEGEKSAGATLLLDDMWRQRLVGLVSGNRIDEPLKNGAHYIQSAIEPFTDLHKGRLVEILKLPVAVIILPDNISLTGKDQEDLRQWIEKGGTLLRFAGPNLAARTNDPLLPVPLRRGEKTVTGDLSGNASGKIAPFPKSSPFQGIAIPDTVKVDTVVLAEPGPDIGDLTWASLENGMPFITAAGKGNGRIVLVHTTANPDWSRIPLSGEFFLKMMRAIVSQSAGTSSQAQLSRALPPLTSLDAQGRLGTANPAARALTAEVLAAGRIDASHPPGFYGDETVRMAVNIGGFARLSPLRDWPPQSRVAAYAENEENDYGAMALAAAVMLIMSDLSVRLAQNKRSSFKPPAPAVRSSDREARPHV